MTGQAPCSQRNSPKAEPYRRDRADQQEEPDAAERAVRAERRRENFVVKFFALIAVTYTWFRRGK